MSPTMAELKAAYEADTALQVAVLSGRIDEADWRMHLWYAMRLECIHPIRATLPVSCPLLLCYHGEVLELMIERGDVPDNRISQTMLDAFTAQHRWIIALQRQNPDEFRDYNQQYMFRFIPTELLDRFREGKLTCGDLMRVNPKAFLPLLCMY